METVWTDMVLNPVRMRIIQYVLVHPQVTARELGEALEDVPQASLYRHIGKLTQAGILEVAGEKRVRGARQKFYVMAAQPPLSGPGREDVHAAMAALMIALAGDFQRYLLLPGADALRDGASLTTSTLLLTDEEYADLSRRIGEICLQAADNAPAAGRRARRLVMLSHPVDLPDRDDGQSKGENGIC